MIHCLLFQSFSERKLGKPPQQSGPASVDEMERRPSEGDCSHTQSCSDAREEYEDLSCIEQRPSENASS